MYKLNRYIDVSLPFKDSVVKMWPQGLHWPHRQLSVHVKLPLSYRYITSHCSVLACRLCSCTV